MGGRSRSCSRIFPVLVRERGSAAGSAAFFRGRHDVEPSQCTAASCEADSLLNLLSMQHFNSTRFYCVSFHSNLLLRLSLHFPTFFGPCSQRSSRLPSKCCGQLPSAERCG